MKYEGLNIIRIIQFEVGRECPNYMVHKGRCPISHPDRYKFSTSNEVILDSDIIGFWRWVRERGFRGVIQWHNYNEPVLQLDRIRNLMKEIRSEDKYQPFQLTTSINGEYSDFDLVKISDYGNGHPLDNRIETSVGEGKPYEEMTKKGVCYRGRGWELPIDNFGNWGLCCGDWTCEESFGSILNTDWDILYNRWNGKRKKIWWNDKETYNILPRLCRACMDKNPTLRTQGGI
jgi:hypothetical protein